MRLRRLTVLPFGLWSVRSREADVSDCLVVAVVVEWVSVDHGIEVGRLVSTCACVGGYERIGGADLDAACLVVSSSKSVTGAVVEDVSWAGCSDLGWGSIVVSSGAEFGDWLASDSSDLEWEALACEVSMSTSGVSDNVRVCRPAPESGPDLTICATSDSDRVDIITVLDFIVGAVGLIIRCDVSMSSWAVNDVTCHLSRVPVPWYLTCNLWTLSGVMWDDAVTVYKIGMSVGSVYDAVSSEGVVGAVEAVPSIE